MGDNGPLELSRSLNATLVAAEGHHNGKQRRRLHDRLEQFPALAIDQRVLAYDEAAARLYGEISARRIALGRPMSLADGRIAAIVKSSRLSFATRNVTEFKECGLEPINPFETAHRSAKGARYLIRPGLSEVDDDIRPVEWVRRALSRRGWRPGPTRRS